MTSEEDLFLNLESHQMQNVKAFIDLQCFASNCTSAKLLNDQSAQQCVVFNGIKEILSPCFHLNEGGVKCSKITWSMSQCNGVNQSGFSYATKQMGGYMNTVAIFLIVLSKTATSQVCSPEYHKMFLKQFYVLPTKCEIGQG